VSTFKRVPLGELALSIVDGPFGSNLKTSDYVEAGVPVLQGKNITHNRFVWTDIRYISDAKAEELKRSKVFVGDHLIIKIGSIGYSAIVDDLAGHACAIIPANMAKVTPNLQRVDSRYLHRWLVSEEATRYFKKVASKTAQPALSLSKIKELQVPLPPLPEQRRIAAILDKADALRAKRREAIAKLDQLLQSVFLDMFGDPVTNPKGWPLLAIGELCQKVTVGIVVRPASHYTESGVPAIRSLNIGVNKIIEDNFVYFSQTSNDGTLAKTKLKYKDVVVVRSGQPGKAAVIPKHLDGANAIDVLIARTKPDLLTPEFLTQFLNSSAGRKLVLSEQRGQIQKHLNVAQLSMALIPLPPTAIQSRFLERATEIERQVANSRRGVECLERLFHAIQSQAFGSPSRSG
jgi:type I restriction enzyme S subunit